MGGPSTALIEQPERSRLPIRIPVIAHCGGQNLKAEVIGSTDNVLLLQGTESDATLPPLGTPVRLRVIWDRQLLIGRLAAHGVAGRFLVSIGERAIRYSRRFPVDLPGIAVSAHLYGPVEVRVIDLSTGGARVKGIDLPVGTEIELHFTPPGQTANIKVLGFAVRAIDGAEMPTLGVAFRLVQPSMDLLGHEGRQANQT
jgi:PilZ domain